MSEFHKEGDHKKHVYIFDNDKFEAELKKHLPDLSYTVVRGKEQDRLRGALEDAADNILAGDKLIDGACKFMFKAGLNDLLEIATSGGSIEPAKVGIILCPDCLEKTIISLEQGVQALKDIQKVLAENAAG